MKERKDFRIDLHNHSPLIPNDYKGDVNTTGAQIVSSAIEAGIDVLAISDHFSVDFFNSVHEASMHELDCSGRALLVLPGAELKVKWNDDEIHFITIFDPASYKSDFVELTDFLKIPETQLTIRNLPNIVIEHDPYLIAEKVYELGGICHIAHMDRFFGSYRLLDSKRIDEFILNAPIAALELVDYSYSKLLHNRTNGIRHIQSSDSHSIHEIGRRTSTISMDELSFCSLKRALRSN